MLRPIAMLAQAKRGHGLWIDNNGDDDEQTNDDEKARMGEGKRGGRQLALSSTEKEEAFLKITENHQMRGRDWKLKSQKFDNLLPQRKRINEQEGLRRPTQADCTATQ